MLGSKIGLATAAARPCGLQCAASGTRVSSSPANLRRPFSTSHWTSTLNCSIRTFRNTDTGPLCDVWNGHNAQFGPECSMTPLQLELCCLSKPYFDPSQLFVAELNDVIVGFAQLGGCPDNSFTDLRSEAAALSALCVIECDQGDAVAAHLLDRVARECENSNAATCAFRPLLPNTASFLGLGPAGSMIGAIAAEQRTCTWLQSAGYEPLVPTNVWQLDLGVFEPPMNRGLMQVRRSSTVNREVDEPLLPWLQACVLGHTEPTAFQLVNRQQKRVVGEVLFWTVGSELQTGPENRVWMWPTQIAEIDSGEFTGQLFLVAEALREFQEEQIDSAIAISAAHDTRQNEFFRRLGFSSAESGVVFERRF